MRFVYEQAIDKGTGDSREEETKCSVKVETPDGFVGLIISRDTE